MPDTNPGAPDENAPEPKDIPENNKPVEETETRKIIRKKGKKKPADTNAQGQDGLHQIDPSDDKLGKELDTNESPLDASNEETPTADHIDALLKLRARRSEEEEAEKFMSNFLEMMRENREREINDKDELRDRQRRLYSENNRYKDATDAYHDYFQVLSSVPAFREALTGNIDGAKPIKEIMKVMNNTLEGPGVRVKFKVDNLFYRVSANHRSICLERSTKPFVKDYESPETDSEDPTFLHEEIDIRIDEGRDRPDLMAPLMTAPPKRENYLEDNESRIYYFDYKTGHAPDVDGPQNPKDIVKARSTLEEIKKGLAEGKYEDTDLYYYKLEQLSERPKIETDMEHLGTIESALAEGVDLTRGDLTFLYEVEAPIEMFSGEEYEIKERIKNILGGRNLEEDLPVVFECEPSQIARSLEKITPDTKVFIGPLAPGVFDNLPEDVGQIYTSFPTGKIQRQIIKVGGKSPNQLKNNLDQAGVYLYDDVKDVLRNAAFETLPTEQTMDVVTFSVGSLMFRSSLSDLIKNADLTNPSDEQVLEIMKKFDEAEAADSRIWPPSGIWRPTMKQLYDRVQELGLELCTPETGLTYERNYQSKGKYQSFYIGMEPINDSQGRPSVIYFVDSWNQLSLGMTRMTGDQELNYDDNFVFCIPKKSPQ